MKKTINVLLSLLLMFSLTACGKTTEMDVPKDSQDYTHQPESTLDITKTEEIITRERAIEIALNKAGLTRNVVVDLEAELDREITGKLWEVDFETREYEHSYDIDANTGEIIASEVKPEDDSVNNPVQQTEMPTKNEDTTISGEESVVPSSKETKAPQSEETVALPKEESVSEPSKETVTTHIENEKNNKDNKDTGKDANKDVNKDTGKDANKDTGKDVNKDTGKDANKDTGKDANNDINKDKVTSELITRESAIEIALKKAGLSRDGVYELEAELDKERGKNIWEVDFETKKYEYSYDIDAKTGEIVLSEVKPEDDKENEPAQKTAKSTKNETVPSGNDSVTTITKDEQNNKDNNKDDNKDDNKDKETTELISRDKAIEIVLKKAGLTKDKVYDLEAELDKEREEKVWEVDFETKEYEYSYEINGETGDIIKQEKDRED